MQDIDEQVKAQQQPTHCHICNAKLTTASVAAGHYSSERHRKNAISFFETIQHKQTKNLQNNKTNPIAPKKETVYCKICNVPFNKDASNKHYQGSEHKKNEELYCNVCLTLTSSKELFWYHLHSTIHARKRKTLGLPEVTGRYSAFDESLPLRLRQMMCVDHCRPCNKTFPTMKHALDHYKGKKHIACIEDWLKVESQPQSEKEEVKREFKGLIQLPINESVKENLQETAATILSVANKKRTLLENSKLNLDKSDIPLKEQVFQEIEKLVKTLYYSKTVPFDVALQYLKKINGEVESLKEKYNKRECSEEPSAVGAEYSVNINYFQKKSEEPLYEKNKLVVGDKSGHLKGKDFLSEDEFLSSRSDTISKELWPVFNRSSHSDNISITSAGENISKETLPDVNLNDYGTNYHITNGTLKNHSNKTLIVAGKEKEEENNEIVCQKSNPFVNKEKCPELKDPDNFETMLKDIILLKQQVEENYPNEDHIEKEVLNEIERLINLVDSDDIPPDVILTYLQNFSRELEQDYGSQIKGMGEVKSDECKGGQAKQRVMWRYSEADLRSLRTEETFRKFPSRKVKKMINETHILYQHELVD